MNWKITNGVLVLERRRIMLRHVTGYSHDGQIVVLAIGGGQISLNAGAESEKMMAGLDNYFMWCGEREEAKLNTLS